jgi:hypothetical protein
MLSICHADSETRVNPSSKSRFNSSLINPPRIASAPRQVLLLSSYFANGFRPFLPFIFRDWRSSARATWQQQQQLGQTAITDGM